MDKVQDIKDRLAKYRKGGEACLWNSDFDTLISEIERLKKKLENERAGASKLLDASLGIEGPQ